VDRRGLVRDVSTECSETDDEVDCGGCGSCCGTGGGGDGAAVEDEEFDALLRLSRLSTRIADSSGSIGLGGGFVLAFKGSEGKDGTDFPPSFTGCSMLSNSQLKLSRKPSKSVVSDGEKRSAEDGNGGG